ncbi:hypothetical protein ABT270_13530 [Streptomyces sp900105245]|uniref:hypothetical protein n=1 Tax=unclassified Streptomyces TaxID=2593676 RepID=UPI00332CF226
MTRDEGRPTSVHLDQVVPAAGGGGAPDFASSPAEKKAAANAIEQHLEPDTAKAGTAAEDSTTIAVKEFDGKEAGGWATSGALKQAHETWQDQVASLLGRLAQEKTALRSATSLFQTTDLGVETRVRAVSPLDKY